MENDLDSPSKEKKFMKMFESEKDAEEKIYKNTLFEFNEEIKGKKESNLKELTHDSLLRRIAMEDYSLFPPKNDSILITDDENLIGKEDPEKLYEEEVNYLRSINQINYLTFSPFGDSFFPYKYKNKNFNNDKEKEKEKENDEEVSDINDRENKILNIIDFDYNNYELNNDLLFNISMGFIDMNKLKHENVVSSDLFVPRSERFNNGRKLVNKFVKKKDVSDKNIFEYDVEFKTDLMDSILKFVNKNENIEFFTKTINNFYKEYTQIEHMNKNIEKNKLLLKWDKIFKERQRLYKNYLIELEKKERQKRKQQKLQKELDEKIYKEKLKQYENQKEFENELERIRIKGLKGLRRNSLINGKKNLNFSLHGSFSGMSDMLDGSSSKTKIGNINLFEGRSSKRRHGKTVYQKRKNNNEDENRNEWLKVKKDYYFFHL